MERVAGLDDLPFATRRRVRRGSWYSFGWSGSPSSSTPSGTIVTFGPRSVSSISTRPPTCASVAAPFGLRASKISTTREAVRDVAPATPPVERPHRQLRPGLADRLRGDDADRVADLAHLARGQERAVAGPAHAVLAPALEDAAHRDREALEVLLQLGRELAQPQRVISSPLARARSCPACRP